MTWFINRSVSQPIFTSSQIFLQLPGFWHSGIRIFRVTRWYGSFKAIKICHPMPEGNVNSLGQAFRSKSIWFTPKYCQWASLWELAEAEIFSYTTDLVTLCNHPSGEKIVCSVSTVEVCHLKYFLMLKEKSFTSLGDKGLTKLAQALDTRLIAMECGSVLTKRIRASYHLKIQPQVMRKSSQVTGCTYSSAILKIFQHAQRTNVPLT